MNQPVSGISISSVIHGAFSFVFGSIPALIKAALIPALINLAAVAIIFFILNPMFYPSATLSVYLSLLLLQLHGIAAHFWAMAAQGQVWGFSSGGMRLYICGVLY